jgi:uncharacterized protein
MSDISPALAEIEALLGEIPLEIDGMILASVEGLIAGIVVLPKPVPNDEWLPLVWGGGETAFPGDPAKSARLVELLLARKAEVIGNFLTGDMAYDPVFDMDIDDSCLWEIWLGGFLDAIRLQPAAPSDWLASDNDDLATAAEGMQLLIQIMNEDKLPKKLVKEMSEMAPDLVGYYAETIYRCQRGLKRVVLN